MNKLHVLFVLLFALATPALGDEATPPSKDKNAHHAKKHAKKAAETKAEDQTKSAVGQSEENRQGKSVVLLGEIGLVDVLHSGVGAEAGYFLTPNRLIEADYLASSFDFLGFKSDINLATLRLKWFVGNSFYVQGGAGVRQMQWTSTDLFDNSVQTSSFSESDLIGEIGIGNRWQWSHFTLGCDWVGYVQPLSKLSSSESFGTGTSDADKTTNRSDFATAVKAGNLVLVAFNLGWAF